MVAIFVDREIHELFVAVPPDAWRGLAATPIHRFIFPEIAGFGLTSNEIVFEQPLALVYVI